MDINDVLQLTDPYNAELITGSKGKKRSVYSIEVMEIPNVEEWLSPGKLLVTTFYTLKDDKLAQKKLLEKLIKNEASGLIVKFGRFINSLPEEMLSLAESKDFPIISIPKEVSYEELLTPLYKQLYVSGNITLIDKLENYSYTNIVSLLNEIYRSFGLVIYIEDLQGALIFSSDYKIRDIWRNSDELFSLPSYGNKDEILKRINLKFTKYIKHNYLNVTKLNRIIIPLYSKGSKYALLHIVYKRKKQKDLVLNPIIFRIVNKIHGSLMGEIVNMQTKHLQNKNKYVNWIKDNSFKLLLNFNLPYLMKHDSMFSSELLLKEEIGKIFETIEDIKNYYIFLNNNDVHAIISISSDGLPLSSVSKDLLDALESSKIYNSYIAMSRVFKNLDEYEKKLEITKKMNRIGKKLYPDIQIFTFEKLGIYTILLDLSNDFYVNEFVDNILKEIKKLDTALMETLKTFLFNNQNTSSTAEKLFLNRKTVTNRLNKIREVADLNLDNQETIFILQFCIKIEDLKQNFSDWV